MPVLLPGRLCIPHPLLLLFLLLVVPWVALVPSLLLLAWTWYNRVVPTIHRRTLPAVLVLCVPV
jgi:hypothetical protein